MNRSRLPLVALLLFVSRAAGAPPQEVMLWPDGPPGVVANAGPGEDDGTGRIGNVGIPALALHAPESPAGNRPVLMVFPGGGYKHLAAFAAGNGAVQAFLPRGLVVVVLKYRTRPPCPDVGSDALADAQRAVRLLRHRATEWGLDADKIAVAGWSAGANLALNLATHWDLGDSSATDPIQRQSCRPDVVALMCPWPWNKKIGDYPITPQSPPAFIASAQDDTTAPTSFAQSIAAGYEAAGVPTRLWLIASGGHKAFSISSTGEGSHWNERFWEWLAWPKPFAPKP